VRSIPMDTARMTLICVIEPKPQIKNFQTGEVATDRDTGANLFNVDLTVIADGRAESIQVSIPEPGLPKGLKMGDVVAATDMSAFLWEKNGRHGTMFRAKALTVKAGA
jgi:hypothetical protein